MQDSADEGQQAAPQWLAGRGEAISETHTLRDFIQLTKPRITLLIVISTAVGYCYGTLSNFNLLTLLHALLGTALMASGSATLNQWYERDLDAQDEANP